MVTEKIKNAVERFKFYQSFIRLWKLLELQVGWDSINALQVGETVGDTSCEHFIRLREINTFPPALYCNLNTSFKTTNEQQVLKQDQNVANT